MRYIRIEIYDSYNIMNYNQSSNHLSNSVPFAFDEANIYTLSGLRNGGLAAQEITTQVDRFICGQD